MDQPNNTISYDTYCVETDDLDAILQEEHLYHTSSKKNYKRKDCSKMRRDIESGLMLPFRTKRIEKINDNGELKQIKAEIRRRAAN